MSPAPVYGRPACRPAAPGTATVHCPPPRGSGPSKFRGLHLAESGAHSPEPPQRRQATRGSWAQLRRSLTALPRQARALLARPTTQRSRLMPCAHRLMCAPCRAGGEGRCPALWSGLCGCLGWRVRGLGKLLDVAALDVAALDGSGGTDHRHTLPAHRVPAECIPRCLSSGAWGSGVAVLPSVRRRGGGYVCWPCAYYGPFHVLVACTTVQCSPPRTGKEGGGETLI